MEKSARPTTLYARLLGASWAGLAATIQDMHRGGTVARGAGLLRVCRGSNCLASWLGTILRLPAAGTAVPVTLVVTPSADGEVWRRTFAGRPLFTRQWRRPDGLLAEQAGPVEFLFRLQGRHGDLLYHPAGVALRLGWLRAPLPRWSAPIVTARESAAGAPGRTEVSVRVSLPVLGLLISYEGPMAWNTGQA